MPVNQIQFLDLLIGRISDGWFALQCLWHWTRFSTRNGRSLGLWLFSTRITGLVTWLIGGMIPVSGLVGFWAWMQLTTKFRWENSQLLVEMMLLIMAWNAVISILESNADKHKFWWSTPIIIMNSCKWSYISYKPDGRWIKWTLSLMVWSAVWGCADSLAKSTTRGRKEILGTSKGSSPSLRVDYGIWLDSSEASFGRGCNVINPDALHSWSMIVCTFFF